MVQAAAALQRAHGVARIGFARRGAATIVRECYQEAGLRVRMPRVEPGLPVEAVVINTAGGLTGGDRFSLAISADEDADAVVTSQAAEKVYRSSGDVATFDTRIALSSGASLDWLPQETILFDGGALRRSLDVDMAGNARFLAVESVVFGRLARGESVDEGFLFDRWRIRRDGRLIYAEGLKIDGAIARALAAPAVAAGAVATASLILVAADAAGRLEAVRVLLDKADGAVEGGASAFEGMLTIRLLSPDPFALRRRLVAVLTLLRGPVPRVWSC
ncbi:MAG: urease accessory protein UreD [Phreatobacter sp.]|uniref:urease accessory protein UreD n=1 Tax=Phreatobacter sp. TaxID=1966341 RepID=UPI001A3F6768|nr:urease accessory protein UreD [Phreatobacter sp.]MBL8569751.1 urease accessory protein UreD [Phreatobacter sp.]